MIYDLLINDNGTAIRKYTVRWQQEGFDVSEEQMQTALDTIYQCTKITKYRDFQYRLVLGKIVTNNNLAEWGISQDNKCVHCKSYIENLEHLFFTCQYVMPIIEWIKELLYIESHNKDLTFEDFLFNRINVHNSHILHFVLIFTKQYIYKCRCCNKKPRREALIQELKYLHDVEWFNACNSEQQKRKFIKRWSPTSYKWV